MTVINAVQIFMLLWSFTAVCQADAGGCSVSCDNVTGTVGKEVNFTCTVSEQCIKECVTLYKFQYLKNDSHICREEPPDNTCEKKKTFTCRYTTDTAMNETFRFFVQTKSSKKTAAFTVNKSAEPVKPTTTNTKAPVNKGPLPYKEGSSWETPVSAISAGVGCFIIIIIIILTIIIIYKKQIGGYRKRMFQATRQNDHDSDTEKVQNHLED